MTPIPASPSGRSVPRRVALLSIVGFWLLYFCLNTLRAAVIGVDDQLEMIVRRAGVTVCGIAIMMMLYAALRRLDRASLGRRVAAGLLLAVPAALIYASVNHTAFYVIGRAGKAPMPLHKFVAAPPHDRVDEDIVSAPVRRELVVVKRPAIMIVDGAISWYFFFLAWCALYLALSYAGEVRVAERRAAAYRDEAQRAQLSALRYQINPHFLFNTLNSLSTLVLSARTGEAERLIINLSSFFRTSLGADPVEDVTLADEIRLQRLYLEIEAVRFPARLEVVIDVPDALLDARVPVLILQPLIENAIRHGVAPVRRPVTIRIAAREEAGRLCISVGDDGDAMPDEIVAGAGLASVCDRLAARFGDRAGCSWARLAEGGFGTTLFVPLMRNGC